MRGKGRIEDSRPRNTRWFAPLLLSAFLLPLAAPGQDLLDLPFKGHYRDKPKTSIVRRIVGGRISSPARYANLKDLLNALPADSVMRTKYPALNQKMSGFPEKREVEELRNVEVDCWIYAVAFEDGRGSKKGDDDFHAVLGDSPNPAHARYMSSEIAGLPVTGVNRAPLTDARRKFLQLFPGHSFTSTFVQISPPKKVKVRGSLFFDGDHEAGCTTCPGPRWAKPKTVWEIHPIYSIEALP